MLITLVRHGETEATGRLIGRTDAPLSELGWAQFRRQASAISFETIVSSPSQRARLPAEALAAERSVPLLIDSDWSELDFGAWDGMTLSDINADPARAAAFAALYRSPEATAAPGGESWSMLEARIRRAIDRITAAGAETDVLVSTHAGPMRAALAVTCALPFATLWTILIGYGTRITLRVGRDQNAGLWGEVIEVAQP